MQRETVDRIINVSQLATLIGGIVYIGMELGRKDEQFSRSHEQIIELGKIVQDLTKGQVSVVERTTSLDRTLEEIKRRLDRLETPK